MKRSSNINELGLALAKAQAQMSNPKKTSDNPFFKSKYADLAEVINVSKHILAAHGLSVAQFPTFQENKVAVETVLIHESGQFISGELSIPISKIDAPSIGSGITYGRRFTRAAICDIWHEDDDDGEKAIGRGQASPKISKKQAHDINQSLEEHDIDKERFVSWLNRSVKADSIEDIREISLQTVLHQIDMAIKKKAGQ